MWLDQTFDSFAALTHQVMVKLQVELGTGGGWVLRMGDFAAFHNARHGLISISWESLRSKRIQDPLEAAVVEVLFVDGGEFGDALLDEEECGPPIVGAATGEVGFAEFRPEGVMEVPAVRREADDLPTGVLRRRDFFMAMAQFSVRTRTSRPVIRRKWASSLGPTRTP